MDAPGNDARAVADLRADLVAADFSVERLGALWGEEAAAALHRAHRAPAIRALDRAAAGGDDAPAATLARLFVLGLPVPRRALETALPTLGVAGAAGLRLVTDGAGADAEILPLVDLRPYAFSDSWGPAEWWIASDPGELTRAGALAENHVLGVGGASLTLSGLMVERPSRLTLDLGTGCGIQAMHASRHSGRVIATDISRRALAFAAFNVALNAIAGVEFRLGSLFDPVEGESFDHIVSNPPFVITPRSHGVPSYEYRDGGLTGDAIVAEVVRGAARHLRPGGIAQLLGNWEYREAGSEHSDGLDRAGAWLERTGLDGWVIEREVQDAALYAETWIRDGGTRAGAQFDRLSLAWLDDFESRGVERVGFGYLLVRRPASVVDVPRKRWRRLERLDGPVSAGLGAHIQASVDAHDWQAALDDFALSRAMLTVAPDVTEERHYWPGDEHPAVMNLRQGGGFARSYPLDTATAAVVGACDGELSIAAICAALGELLEVDADELLAQVLPSVREFVTVGILRRPGS
ncbi:MAG TPA: methyltransferase [Galbitalea sp.]|jgi:methylase of polypeptide subunit release factors